MNERKRVMCRILTGYHVGQQWGCAGQQEVRPMMVTSPGLDELHAILTKRQAEEDAVTIELERRRAGLVSEIATLQEAIRILEAEHAASPSLVDAPATHRTPEANESTPEASAALPDAQDPHVDTQEPVEADTSPLTARGPSVALASISTPATRPRRVRGPNWQRELAGLRQSEAVVRIAERSGGTVTVAMLAQILVDVGLTRAVGKLARGQAARVLGESPRFERMRRGTYRLRSCESAFRE
jgi:hypothetical protein